MNKKIIGILLGLGLLVGIACNPSLDYEKKDVMKDFDADIVCIIDDDLTGVHDFTTRNVLLCDLDWR